MKNTSDSMKNINDKILLIMKKLIVLFLALFIVSCNNQPKEDEGFKLDRCKFSFVNKSGVEVAVLVKHISYDDIFYFNFPDSIVLGPDQEYSWDIYLQEYYTKTSPAYHPNPPLGEVRAIKLYFDKTVLKEYKSYPKEDRYPADMSNYVKSASSDERYKKQWTYTFTEEDYQKALEQNKK